jgi:hypothetical protein
MKVVASISPSRYLVEVSGYELQALSGLTTHTENWKIGTDVEVMKSVGFLRDLRTKEEQVRVGVAAMSAIGEMLLQGLPTFIVCPPPAPEEETVRGDPS